MPTTGLTMSIADQERHESARRAILASRKLLHGWETMARMLARSDKLKVELTSAGTSCTDGKTIYIKVPPELGEELIHDADLCQKRDEFLVPLCHACCVYEDVNITVIHEVSHVIFGTFEDVTAFEKAQLLTRAILSEAENNPDSKRAAALRKRIEQAPPEKKSDYLNLSDIISPYLPFLINACEDIRVNNMMQADRPGTRKMFEGQITKVFRDGVRQHDGSVMFWKDAAPNAQAAIGVYCKTGGLKWREYLDSEVADKLDDPELDSICDKMRSARSVREVYRLSFPLLENLRRLGFMKAPDEPEDEPEPQTPPNPQDSEENQDDPSEEGSPGEGDDPGEGGEDGEGEGDSGGTPEDRDDSEASSESGSPGETGDDGDASDGSPDDSASETGAGDDDPGEDASGGDSPGEVEDQDGDGTDNSGQGEASGDSPGDGSEPSGEAGASKDVRPPSDAGTAEGTPGSSDNQGESSPPTPNGQELGDRSEGTSPQDDSSSDGNGDPSDGPADQSDSQESSPVDEPGATGDTPAEGQDAAPGDACQPDEEGPVPDADRADGTPDSDGKDNGKEDDKSSEPYTAEDQARDGLPEDVEHLFKVFGQHDKQTASPSEAIEETRMTDAIELSLGQIDFFDSPSMKIAGVNVHRYDDERPHRAFGVGSSRRKPSTTEIKVPEPIITGSLTRLRLVFQDNMRGKKETNLHSGKVNGRALARRVPIGDDRIFKKTTQPGRKDYFVVIGIDCSGSTSSPYEHKSSEPRLTLMKMAVSAKADMLNRLGIPFALYAHSGGQGKVEIFEIKGPKEPWSKKQKEALASLQPYSANLDGHTLEFYRKIVQRRTETDRLILYYTDGAMPAANFEEELVILQREIKMCERLGVHLVGIGVNSDSPTEHGLDTILLDDVSDIKKVVKGLQDRLT